MNRLKVIIKKEIRLIFRSKTYLLLAVTVCLLSFLAIVTGVLSYQQQQDQISRQQEKKRNEWLTQGDKHPHIAAHYGTFAFKPKTILSILDTGLDAFTGTSVYLEAHYQHEFMFRPARDHGSMIRFGQLNMAMVLQVLLPLMIIFLGFTTFGEEKKTGTLKLMISQGVALGHLIWGKIISLFLIIILTLIPALGLILILTSVLTDQSVMNDPAIRSVTLGVLYLCYLFVFVVITVLVSLWASSVRTALLTMLGFWIIVTLIVPKTATDIGQRLYPLPSMREYKAARDSDLMTGVGDMDDRDTYYEKLLTTTLEKYQVDSVQNLPLNYEGMRMQAGEEYGNRVHDHHQAVLRRQFHKQNQLSSLVSLINPFLAVRNLSMTISGTDLHSTIDFEDQAEAYRRDLVARMNKDMADNSAYGEFYGYKASDELWSDISDFSYRIPHLKQMMTYYPLEMTGMGLWLLIPLLLIWYSSKKFRNFS